MSCPKQKTKKKHIRISASTEGVKISTLKKNRYFFLFKGNIQPCDSNSSLIGQLISLKPRPLPVCRKFASRAARSSLAWFRRGDEGVREEVSPEEVTRGSVTALDPEPHRHCEFALLSLSADPPIWNDLIRLKQRRFFRTQLSPERERTKENPPTFIVSSSLHLFLYAR